MLLAIKMEIPTLYLIPKCIISDKIIKLTKLFCRFALQIHYNSTLSFIFRRSQNINKLAILFLLLFTINGFKVGL